MAAASLTIKLSQSLKNFIDQQVSKGRFDSPEKYIQTLIREAAKSKRNGANIESASADGERFLEKIVRNSVAQVKLDRLIQEGLESGDPIEITPEYWRKKRRRLAKSFPAERP